MRTSLILVIFLVLTISGYSQTLGELTVEKIMRDPKWIGVAPSNVSWSPDGKTVYFNWNAENAISDSLYKITMQNRVPQKVSKKERMALVPLNRVYNRDFSKLTFEKEGDIFLHDIASNKTIQITNTVSRESAPLFSGDERRIVYSYDQNLYSWEIATGNVAQLTDFRKGKKSTTTLTDQEKWLKQDQLANLQILKERNDKKEASDKIQKSEEAKRPKEIYVDDKSVEQARLTPDGNYVTFRLTKNANPKATIVPSYVTTSGFTEDI